MENFIVSARKYRPQEFDSVVGQSHITDTLEHAIENNQLAWGGKNHLRKDFSKKNQ